MVLRDTTGGGSCCGGFLNDEFISMPEAYCESREDTMQVGRLYRSLHDSYGDDLDVHQVDPRNTFAILGYMLRWWHEGQITAAELGHQLLFDIRPGAWFYNGRLLNSERSPRDVAILDRVRTRHTQSAA